GLSRGWARQQARGFLQAHLSEGPRPAHEIWPLAQKQGISQRTLRRAKKDLSIRAVRVTSATGPESYWLLPGQEPPGPLAPHGPSELEPWLAPLRQMFPSAPPFEDD